MDPTRIGRYEFLRLAAMEIAQRITKLNLARKQAVDSRSDLQAGKRALLACFQDSNAS